MAYFSPPAEVMNPVLFEDDGSFKQDVRQELLTLLDDFWSHRYNRWQEWATVWIAGSAVTSQWKREGLGDLDILIGVDFEKFLLWHPMYRFYSEESLAQAFNREFKEELWPETENLFGHEVTWYVNPGAADIRAINPYAAYNLTADEWTVPPPDLPENWSYESFPVEWRLAAEDDYERVSSLHDRWAKAREALLHLSGPRRVTAEAEAGRLEREAQSVWDEIHGGRRNAFNQGLFRGAGFFDFANFRWQAGKTLGTIALLQEMR